MHITTAPIVGDAAAARAFGYMIAQSQPMRPGTPLPGEDFFTSISQHFRWTLAADQRQTGAAICASHTRSNRVAVGILAERLWHNAFLVPDCASAQMADPQLFWAALQAQNLGPLQHLWAGPTI